MLDSLGTGMQRKDLNKMVNKDLNKIFSYSLLVQLIICHLFVQQLEGLEKLFKFASEHMELNSDKWKDLNVTTWPRKECIKRSLQTDGYNS